MADEDNAPANTSELNQNSAAENDSEAPEVKTETVSKAVELPTQVVPPPIKADKPPQFVTPGSPGAISQSSSSAKQRLDEDLKRWRTTALKLATQPLAKSINDEDYLLAREHYRINRNKEFASGQYAKLYHCHQGNRQLACKITPLTHISLKYKNNFNEAIRVMRYLTDNMHPSIVVHVDIYSTDQKLYTMMELLSGPDLNAVVYDAALYDKFCVSQRAKKWTRDVTEGVHFLYVCGIAHCNVRPSNVVLCAEGHSVKLVGFNQSMSLFDPYEDKEKMHEKQSEFNSQLAPECMKGPYRPVLADVWAIGILLVQLLSRHPPFKMKVSKYDDQLRFHLHKHRVAFEANLMDLLSKCFEVDPLVRIDTAAMLLHPYMN